MKCYVEMIFRCSSAHNITQNLPTRNNWMMCIWLLTTLGNFRFRFIKELFSVKDGWPISWFDIELLFFFFCNHCCLFSSALILHGDCPGGSKQQPHTADSTGLSLPCHPHHCCHMEGTFGRHHFMPLSPSLQERGERGEVKREGGKEGGSPWADARQRWQQRHFVYFH